MKDLNMILTIFTHISYITLISFLTNNYIKLFLAIMYLLFLFIRNEHNNNKEYESNNSHYNSFNESIKIKSEDNENSICATFLYNENTKDKQ